MTPIEFSTHVHATRQALQKRIADHIAAAIAEFHEKTGMGITAVTVNLVDVTQVQDQTRRTAVDNVRMSIALE